MTEWLDRTDYIVCVIPSREGRANLLVRRYAWFGAVRDGTNLHGVHPFNRLMDEHGQISPLSVLLIRAMGPVLIARVGENNTSEAVTGEGGPAG